MKLIIDGDVNVYYVQTLCMIFFPGAKFGESEVESPENPTLEIKITPDDSGVYVFAELRYMNKIYSTKRYGEYSENMSKDKVLKIAIGSAVLTVAGEMTGYRPSWGMLTGVRPSKVSTELLLGGMSKTRVKKTISSDYMVIPKKASLATEVALNEIKIIGNPQKKDCSVYISIPFCPTRCSYCSFVSYSSKKLLSLIPEYLEKLIVETKQIFGMINKLGLDLKTVYIGGGTPTTLDEKQLELLLGTINDNCDVSKLEEYTLEAGRPDTITAEKLAVAKKYGVTRISVNPQTLNDELLVSIGRTHTVEMFYKAYDIARNSGIKCINTDLIAGLPGDSFSSFSETFDKIIGLNPENITVHTFCVKKAAEIRHQGNNVYSARGGDVGKCVDYSQIRSLQAGYNPYYMYRQKNTVGNYENVGFAKASYEGRYNIYMMEEVHSIFAAGAGAVTKLVKYSKEKEESFITRLFNPKYPYEYLANDKISENLRSAEEFYIKNILD